MKPSFNRILPTNAGNNYTSSRFASVVFLLLAIVGVVRSCIHLFAPDGGAGTIAGLDLTVAGAEGIIFAFSLWGSAQLLYALFQLIVYWRYKTLIPLMYLIMAAENLLRFLVGQIKPVTFAHTPPGAISNYILLPLSLIMCYLSLRNWQNPAVSGKPSKPGSSVDSTDFPDTGNTGNIDRSSRSGRTVRNVRSGKK